MATSGNGTKKNERKRRTKTSSATSNAAPSAGPTENTDRVEAPELLAMIGRGVVPPVLHDPKRRAEMGLPANEDDPGEYMIELNIEFRGGLREASKAFQKLWKEEIGSNAQRLTPIEISKSYYRILLSVKEWKALLKRDEAEAQGDPRRRVIYKLWPDFKVKALIDHSVATVKADAAFKSYSASGAGISWAVIDSGIDGTHPHFGTPQDPDNSVIYHPGVSELHYDFTQDGVLVDDAPAEGTTSTDESSEEARENRERARRERARAAALRDELGHGTHVAGIISGRLPTGATPFPKPRQDSRIRFAVFEQVFESDREFKRQWGKLPVQREVRDPEALHGVAPHCTLVSLKVLNQAGEGRVSDIMRALVYVREHLNDDPKMLRVHGVT